MPCQHRFRQSAVTDYERCEVCGTFRSRIPVDQEKMYGNNAHWNAKHGSLWEQVWNVDMHTENGVCKNRFVLDRIEVVRGAALDMGCAPGRLLYWLKYAARFESVKGIDTADGETIKKIACGVGELIHGLFPEATRDVGEKVFDYVCALDTFEHSPTPVEFVEEAFRLLTPGGQLFLMLPLAETPRNSRFFNAAEHIYLHSAVNMRMLLDDAGFGEVHFDKWAVGHDTVSARKPLLAKEEE